MKMITEIPALTTYAVRHAVLRPGKPVESCLFEGDDADTTIHFGVFIDGVIVGAASLFENRNNLFPIPNQFQLRGMAVLENYQKKGFGDDLVKHAEDYSRKNNVQLIWFNARIAAVPFYEKLGYQRIGDSFGIGDIGAHYIMHKIL